MPGAGMNEPTTLAPAFTWGAAGQKLSPISDRRSIAEALLKSGTNTAPIQSWTQGLDRMGSALAGAYELNQLDAQYGRPAPSSPMAASPNSAGLFGLAGTLNPWTGWQT